MRPEERIAILTTRRDALIHRAHTYWLADEWKKMAFTATRLARIESELDDLNKQFRENA